jgi:hypothetical protein
MAESIRNHILSGGALAFALSLSLQRYFPGSLSNFSLNKVTIDLSLITVCLFTVTNMALMKNWN